MRPDLSELPAWARWMFSSWRVGRLFGVDIRIHVLTVLVPIAASGAFTGMVQNPWLWGLATTGLLYLVILSHEFGHIAAGWRYRIPTHEITLSPLGGLAHMQAPPPNPRAEILVALAGPAVHLLWLGFAYGLGEVAGASSFRVAYVASILWHMNLGLLCFNLLPFFPMDGGRTLRGLLALRWHPNLASLRAAQIGMAGGVLLIAGGAITGGYYGILILAIGLNNLLVCWHEVRAARFSEGPYGEPRQPWEQDPEAWKSGSSDRYAGEERRVERHRQKKTAAVEAKAHKDAAMAEELDRILAKVAEVGMGGLTEEEKSTLDSASARIRTARRRDR